MRFIDSWKGWRNYRKLEDEWKKIVFFSESGQDWHYFAPLITELQDRHSEKVTYVTSDHADPGLSLQHPLYRSVFIPEGLFLIIHFQLQKAAVVVMTMMDLSNLHLKKSINPVHYIYLFHSLGSTHMVDNANSYDAYDSLFCPGPQHVAELRKREELAGLPARNLFEFGHPRLEQLVTEAARHTEAREANANPVVLIAPTWGDDSIFNRCGQELLSVLLDAGYELIMRPHYQTRRLTPGVIDRLVNEFGSHERFSIIEQMGETASLFHSDLLICDWSSMAIEYALGLEKPVLFIDLPRRVRNPAWQELGIEPFESSIREKAGTVLPEEELRRAPEAINRLLEKPQVFRAGIARLREHSVFNPGVSIEEGAREISRLAAQAGELRESRRS